MRGRIKGSASGGVWSSVLFNVMLLVCRSAPITAKYHCTAEGFIRLGNSCYYLSPEIVQWQEAHFRCRDKGAQLAVLATQYEDSTLRNYLERPEFAQLGRWIGGMWVTREQKWIWAAQGIEIDNRRGFATTSVTMLPQNDEWMCLYMDPRHRYRWSNENCVREMHYVCEAPLTKVMETAGKDVSNATTDVPLNKTTHTEIYSGENENNSTVE